MEMNCKIMGQHMFVQHVSSTECNSKCIPGFSSLRAEAENPEEAEMTVISPVTSSTETTIERSSLFDARRPSALKVTDIEVAQEILIPQIQQGWRWVTPQWLTNSFSAGKDYIDPAVRAKQMPVLSVGDWVIMEGKTMRLIHAASEDEPTKALLKRLEDELVKTHENSTDEVSTLTDQFSPLNVNQSITALYPADLSIHFFENSYARLAGAYIRHLERLPKLQNAFDRFFSIEEKIPKRVVSVRKVVGNQLESPILYTKILSVKLKNDPLTIDDLLLIHQALGIIIDEKKITAQSTVENTIPFKKVLEMLTCFDTVKYRDRPWFVGFNIFGSEKNILLSTGQNEQLTVSLLRPSNDESVNLFIKAFYPYWMRGKQLTAGPINDILNNPLSHSAKFNDDWKDIFEFIVRTQVVEAHCTPGRLEKSLVPGSAKQMRGILRHHIEDGNTKIASSFIADKVKNKRVFPMASADGAENTRNAVNELMKQDGIAPCTDMSEDSDVEV